MKKPKIKTKLKRNKKKSYEFHLCVVYCCTHIFFFFLSFFKMSKQNKSDQSKSEEITDEKAVIWLLLLLCLS